MRLILVFIIFQASLAFANKVAKTPRFSSKSQNIGQLQLSAHGLKVNRLLNQAIANMQSENYSEARTMLRQSIALAPECRFCYLSLAFVALQESLHRNVNLWDESRENLLVAYKLPVKNPRWHDYTIDRIRKYLVSESPQNMKEIHRQLFFILQKQYKKNPENTSLKLFYGEVLLANIRYFLKKKKTIDQFSQKFESVIDIRDNNFQPLVLRFLYLRYLQILDLKPELRTYLGKASKQLPNDIGYYPREIAKGYILIGQYTKAKEYIKDAIERDEIYFKSKKIKDARSYYEEGYLFNFYLLWFISLLNSQKEEAKKIYVSLSKLAKRVAGAPTLTWYQSMPLIRMAYFGEWREILDFEASSLSAYTSSYYHFARGLAYASQKEYLLGISQLKAINKLSRKESSPLEKALHELSGKFLTAYIRWRQGKMKDSLYLFKAASTLEKKFSRSYTFLWLFFSRYFIAQIYEQRFQKLKASEEYKKVQDKWPNIVKVKNRLDALRR